MRDPTPRTRWEDAREAPLGGEVVAWAELFRSEDLMEARAVLTTVAAMEFDARLVGRARPGEEDEPHEETAEAVDRPWSAGWAARAERPEPGDPPYVVEVPAADRAELAEVLDVILEEQAEFDASLARRGTRLGWEEQLAAAVLSLVSAILGVLGMAEV